MVVAMATCKSKEEEKKIEKKKLLENVEKLGGLGNIRRRRRKYI
jgi:hypothetical protein